MLREYCSGESTQEDLDVIDIFYIPRHKLLWCPVYKAATTTWFEHIIRLEELQDKVSLNKVSI